MKREKRNTAKGLLKKQKKPVPQKALPALHMAIVHETCEQRGKKPPLFFVKAWKDADAILECPNCKTVITMYVGTGYTE